MTEFNIGKKKPNVNANEACSRAEYENFQGKGQQHVKCKKHQKNKQTTLSFTPETKNVKPQEFMSGDWC